MKKILKKGFTLVELVVVIAIIAILAAVSTGGYFVYIQRAQEVEATNFGYTLSTYIKTLQKPTTFDSNIGGTKADKPTRNFTFSYSQDGLKIKINYSYYDLNKNGKPITPEINYDVNLVSYGVVSGAISRFLSFYFETKEIIYDGNNKRVDSSDPTAERYAIGYGNDSNPIKLGEKDTNGIYNDVKVKTEAGDYQNVTERGIFIGNKDRSGLIPSLKSTAKFDTLKEVNIHELYYISSFHKAYLIQF